MNLREKISPIWLLKIFVFENFGNVFVFSIADYRFGIDSSQRDYEANLKAQSSLNISWFKKD